MGRKDTFQPSPFDDRLNEELEEETLGSIADETEDSIEFDFDKFPKLDESTVKNMEPEQKVVEEPPVVKPKKTKKPPTPFLDIETKETARRTFVISKELDDILDSLVINKKTGRRITGRKGVLSKLMNNALIREFVEIGLLDESSLDELESY